jgi:hypothetical protein
MTKTAAAQAFHAILTIVDVGFSRTFRIDTKMRGAGATKRAPHPPALRRQHFLKRDAVFFDVLVYSGCSAFRFPSARSDQSDL